MLQLHIQSIWGDTHSCKADNNVTHTNFCQPWVQTGAFKPYKNCNKDTFWTHDFGVVKTSCSGQPSVCASQIRDVTIRTCRVHLSRNVRKLAECCWVSSALFVILLIPLSLSLTFGVYLPRGYKRKHLSVAEKAVLLSSSFLLLWVFAISGACLICNELALECIEVYNMWGVNQTIYLYTV
jgi:hypothetical protein